MWTEHGKANPNVGGSRMRVAVFTDIHGNVDALRRILSSIRKNKIEKTIFLGDVFFRGDKVKECIDLLIEENIICIAGNCELYFQKGVEIDPDVIKDKDYYDQMRCMLPGKYVEWVKHLDKEILIQANGHKIYLAHFLMQDRGLSYPYYPLASLTDGSFDGAIIGNPYDLMIFGHSHQKFVKGNVISVPAAGLEQPEYLIVNIDDEVNYEFVK